MHQLMVLWFDTQIVFNMMFFFISYVMNHILLY